MNEWYFEPACRGTIDWNELFKMFPILKSLEGIEQNPEYHKEGNVLNHTKLVMDFLIRSRRFMWENNLNKSILFLSGLFHDIGKIAKTTEAEGVFSSKGHSAEGARMVRQILWDYKDGYKVPFYVREYVSAMVLLHMMPYYLLEKEDPLYSVCASSYTISNFHLSMLSEADILGRICDKSCGADNVELFKMFCEENRCYDNKKEFRSDHSRFLYFFERKGHPDLERYFDCKGTVHMMSGLSGSGKDYYIKKNLSHLPVVGLDDIREELDVKPTENEGEVSQISKERCKEHMRKGVEFVLNATNLIKSTRARWIGLFGQYGYKIHIHYIEPSFATVLKQNTGRSRKVPEDIICKMFEKLEPPTMLECHELSLEAK